MKELVSVMILVGMTFASPGPAGEKPAVAKQPMTFMDVVSMSAVRGWDLSPDRRFFVYEVSSLDWKENKRFSDIYLASTKEGPGRQMTFTGKKNETAPRWHPGSGYFAFLSDRTDKNQIYFMKPDGGEAWPATDAKEAVSSFAWNKDGRFLAYLTGKDKDVQLWVLPEGEKKPLQLTQHETPIETWLWSTDGKSVYFIAPDRYDELDAERTREGFDVRIVKPAPIQKHLWVITVEEKKEKRITSGSDYSVESPVVSDNGRYVAFIGASTNRYATSQSSEVYLYDSQTGKVERLTRNHVEEGDLSFSPDGKWIAYAAPEEYTYMRREKIYLYPLGEGKPIVIPQNFDLDAGVGFWGDKGDSIFFNVSDGTAYNLFSVSCVEGAEAMRVTNEKAELLARRHKETGLVVLNYSDPSLPPDYYLADVKTLSQRGRWTRLTEANPQVRNLNLGSYEDVTWKSSDGKTIGGILIYPLSYEKGKRYPLIVQIHGGPAGAYTFSFSDDWGTYTNVFAANGYAVFQPNYRGSSGYGEKFRMQISGDYFRQAYDDIMTGVDDLVRRGIADPERMGMMGWSAGGHWSNWTLVSSDRFKAISTGAGSVNWISLYAETDQQDPREFYFQGTPYDNWDGYVRVSPLKYIKKARTPTLIHFGEKDQRIPMPQGQELHMALQKLGVPTEFIVYPGMPHGLTNARYQLVKMEAEMAWFEKWIKGKEGWLDWSALTKTLKEQEEVKSEKSKDKS